MEKLPGIQKVNVNAGTGTAELMIEGSVPTLAELQAALGDDKYRVRKKTTRVRQRNV